LFNPGPGAEPGFVNLPDIQALNGRAKPDKTITAAQLPLPTECKPHRHSAVELQLTAIIVKISDTFGDSGGL